MKGFLKFKFTTSHITEMNKMDQFSLSEVEKTFKQLAEASGIKPGEVMPLFRVLLIGLANGPALFEMVVLLGKDEVVKRLSAAINRLN